MPNMTRLAFILRFGVNLIIRQISLFTKLRKNKFHRLPLYSVLSSKTRWPKST